MPATLEIITWEVSFIEETRCQKFCQFRRLWSQWCTRKPVCHSRSCIPQESAVKLLACSTPASSAKEFDQKCWLYIASHLRPYHPGLGITGGVISTHVVVKGTLKWMLYSQIRPINYQNTIKFIWGIYKLRNPEISYQPGKHAAYASPPSSPCWEK